jgi:glycosyltransferase involved in cell wall biosynthesis
MNTKKIISVSVPCFNEEENVAPMARAVIDQFEQNLIAYDYRIQFIDNCSTDNTRKLIEDMCANNNKIRAIFNAHNFGGISGYHGILQSDGDCTITIPCDFQVPVELFPAMVRNWEEGSKIVCAIKTSSKENKPMWLLRTLYYKLMQRFSDVKVIEHFTGAGLYDREFLDLCRQVDTPVADIAPIISTLGYDITTVEFEQPLRRAGKSKNNFWSLFDTAIYRFINYSNVGPRVATLLGFFASIASFLVGLIYLILKLANWYLFSAGVAPVVILIRVYPVIDTSYAISTKA